MSSPGSLLLLLLRSLAPGVFPHILRSSYRDHQDNFSEAVTVLEEIRHPEFDDFLLPHDVMILKLENEVTNPGLSLVGLAGHSTRVSPNELLTVMGYGFDFFMEPTEKLRFANVPFVDDAICVDLYSDHPFLYVEPDQMICAGDIVSGGVDACFGDSGKFGMEIFTYCRIDKRKNLTECYNKGDRS